jgi:hypothetical protein
LRPVAEGVDLDRFGGFDVCVFEVGVDQRGELAFLVLVALDDDMRPIDFLAGVRRAAQPHTLIERWY